MTLRKLVLAVVFVFSPYLLFPRSISFQEALSVAERIVRAENHKGDLRTSRGTYSIRAMSYLFYHDIWVGYLVDLDPQGFLIMSDISELTPVRFISFDSSYSRVREHSLIQGLLLSALLTKQKLGYLPDINDPSSERVLFQVVDYRQLTVNESLWDRFLENTDAMLLAPLAASGAPLLSSRWNQDDPYNLLTPLLRDDSGSWVRTPSGCVATALAQIMNYWKYPDVGQGGSTYYWTTGRQYLSVTFNTAYDWPSMLDTYGSAATQRQRSAVAVLMRDVGYSVDMDYDINGSGASLGAADSLTDHFKYSPDLYALPRNYRSADDWFSMFRRQMDQRWPAVMGISAGWNKGHAVVVDGYRTDYGNQLHINMGWGGADDNYYSVDDILYFSYLFDQAAVINIHPPADRAAPTLWISNYQDMDAVGTEYITLTGTASDAGRGNSGISSVTVNGVRASGDTATGAGIASWTCTVRLTPGPNVIRVIAQDASPYRNSVSQSIRIHYYTIPTLMISQTSTQFDYEVGSSTVPAQTISIRSFPTHVAYQVSVSEGADWMTVTPSAGTTPAEVTVSVDPGKCGMGSFAGDVSIDSPSTKNGVQVLHVTLAVTLPTLSINLPRISFGAEVGSSTTLYQDLTISRKTVGAPILIKVTEQPEAQWLSVGAVSCDRTPCTIKLMATAKGMSAGTYWGGIDIASEGTANKMTHIDASLTVKRRPTVFVRPASVNFSYQTSRYLKLAKPEPQKLTVYGQGTKVRLLPSTGLLPKWLSISPLEGATPLDLTLSVDPTGLTADTYAESVQVYSSETDNGSGMFDVVLHVSDTPLPMVTPSDVSLQVQYGSRQVLTADLLTYTNGSVMKVDPSSSGGTWLSVQKVKGVAGEINTGTLEVMPVPAVMTVSANPAGLTVGKYSGSVIISKRDDPDTKVEVPVTLTVTPNALVVPQIADGGNWNTTIVLQNTDTEPAPFTLKFWRQDGTPWLVPIEGRGNVSEYADTIPVGAVRMVKTTGTDPVTIAGWAELTAERSIGGTAVFCQHGSRYDSEAGVLVAPASGRRFIIPFDNKRGFLTGVALANTASVPSTLTVNLRDENGTVIGSGNLTLPARSQKAFLLPQVYPQTTDRRGVAEFACTTVDIAAIGLRLSAEGTFTSLQPITYQPGSSAISTRSVSQIADGGDWATTIVLVNPGNQPAPFSIIFRQANGTPLSMPLAGMGSVSDYSDIIPPGGMRMLESEGGTGTLRSGWAELISKGTVGGTVIFAQRTRQGLNSEGTVQLVPSLGERSVMPFDNSEGYLTAVALLNENPSDIVGYTATVRDENGTVLATESLGLAERRRETYFLADRFPVTRDRRGTIEFSGARISVLGLRFNPLGAFTSMPPIPR